MEHKMPIGTELQFTQSRPPSTWPSENISLAIVVKVQRYFTKTVAGIWSMSNDKRLLAVSLQTLQYQRVINDLILYYKIKNGLFVVFVVQHVASLGRSDAPCPRLTARLHRSAGSMSLSFRIWLDTEIRNNFNVADNFNTRGYSCKLIKQHCTMDAT